MPKTVKSKITYESKPGEAGTTHYTMRNSLRGSGRIRKRIVLGEKFDYGKKEKEKENYVLFVAGQGQEKKEIEEMEQITGQMKKNEKIVEEKEIIDNYQYHETKDIKKKNPKESQTIHERLCSPFERTKIKKYASYTSEPKQSGYKVIKTTNLVDKNDYSRNFRPTNKYKNGSFNPKIQNSSHAKTEANNSHIYETYKPPTRNKNMYVSTHINNKSERSTSYGGIVSSNNNNQRKNKINGQKSTDHIQYNYTKTKPKQTFCPQKIVNYEYQEGTIDNQPSYGHISVGIGNRKTETTLDSEYTYKISTITNKRENKVSAVQRIKYGSQSKPEKTLVEGPKYTYNGPDPTRPKSGNLPRRRPMPRPKQKKVIRRPKKGYIPFGGHGTKVGQGSLISQIPKPMVNPYTKNTLETEEIITTKIEKNVSYTNLSQTTDSSSKTNIKSLNDLKENKSLSNINNVGNYKKIRSNSKKFPGKGVRVGGTDISELKKVELNSKTNTGMSYSEYRKYEQKINKTDHNEKCYEERLCYRGEDEGMFREIICPVHGRQIIKLSNPKK